MAKIRIQLTGQFQVLAGDGSDITPSSAKSRGLLCILCLSPRLVRSRRWIEGILWSDRGEKQAQESLRTELSKMRREFGTSKEVLEADNMNISLDRSRVAIDILDEPYRAAMALREGDELFEGVLVRSPGFEDWLHTITAEQTKRLLNVAEPRPAPVFVVSAQAISQNDAPAKVLAESLASSIEQKISEYTNVNVLAPDVVQMQIATGQRGLRLTIRTAMGSGDKADVFISMDRLEDARRLDTIRHSVPAEANGFFDNEIADAVSYEAVQVVLATLHSSNTPATEADRADPWVTEAAADIMSAVPSRLVRGKGLLDRVQLHEEENPRALAWRAMLAMTMRNERVLKDQWLCDEEIAYLQRRAFELAPRNGLVLGLVSLSASYGTGDMAFARATSDMALRRSQSDPYAVMANAVLSLRDNRLEDAVAKAMRARRIALSSPHLHWWEMAVALTKIAAGDTASARAHVESAFALAPQFRAAGRHLYALNLHSRDEQAIERSERHMRALEPDFTLDRMRDDQTYPASTIRKAGLLNVV